MEVVKKSRMASPRKRLAAFVMTLVVMLTNALNNASIVALASELDFPEVIFGMTAEELKDGAQYALESGDVFDVEELGLEAGSASKAYKRLFDAADGKQVYEFLPPVRGDVPEGTDIRAFVCTEEGTNHLEDDAEIIFLFLNDTEESIGFAVNIDGYITEKVLVSGRAVQIEEEEKETTKAPETTAPEEGSSQEITEGSGSGTEQGEGTDASGSEHESDASIDEMDGTTGKETTEAVKPSDEETAEKETTEKETAEKETTEKETAEKETTEKETAEKEAIEKERPEKEPTEKEPAEKENPAEMDEGKDVASISRKTAPMVGAGAMGEADSGEAVSAFGGTDSEDVLSDDGEMLDEVLNLGKLASRSLGTVTLEDTYKARAIVVKAGDLAEGKALDDELEEEGLLEDETLLEETLTEEGAYPAFNPEPVVVDGVTITLSADAGIIPEGTVVKAERIHDTDVLSLMDEAEARSGEVKTEVRRIAFDIMLLDAKGNQVEFDDKTVSVVFSGSPIEEMTRDANMAMIAHVDAEAGVVEPVMEQSFPVEETLQSVAFDAEHFSNYVFEASYQVQQASISDLAGQKLYAGVSMINGTIQKGIWEDGDNQVAYCHNYRLASPSSKVDDKLMDKADELSFVEAADTVWGHPVGSHGDKKKKFTVNSSGKPIGYQFPLYFKYQYEEVIGNPEWIFNEEDCKDAEANVDKIMNLLYAGYPFDSLGLARKYGVEERGYYFTQSLLWYLCDKNADTGGYGGMPYPLMEPILSGERQPANDNERYLKALYDSISDGTESCRIPRLILDGDTELKLQDDGFYRSGQIDTYSAFNGEFRFRMVPDGYHVFTMDGKEVRVGADGDILTAGDSFYLAASGIGDEESGQEFSLAIDYMHDDSELSYYRYINKVIEDNKKSGETAYYSFVSGGSEEVNLDPNAYQDLVRLEVTDGSEEIRLNVTIVPGEPPEVNPNPDSDPIDPPTDPSTGAPTDPSTEAPSDPTTEAPSDPSTEAPTNPTTSAPTTAPETTVPGGTGTGGNSGGGNGGNGTPTGTGSGNGNPGGGPGVTTTTTIDDNPTPLADAVTIDSDPIPLAGLPTPVMQLDDDAVLIDDGEIPLAAIPKTGNQNSAAVHMFMLSSALLTAFGLFAKKKKAN